MGYVKNVLRDFPKSYILNIKYLIFLRYCLAKLLTNKKPEAKNSTPINENIKYKEVRLIGVDGEALGIVSLKEAISNAEKASLDLVLVSENSNPPVCKILDYGKYKYEQQKKKAESRKKQKVIEIKEVQLRPFIGENDLLIKCKAIKKFIESGAKVKVVLKFRGRELSRQDLGFEVIKKVLDYSKEFAKEENPAKLEGSSIITVLTKI